MDGLMGKYNVKKRREFWIWLIVEMATFLPLLVVSATRPTTQILRCGAGVSVYDLCYSYLSAQVGRGYVS